MNFPSRRRAKARTFCGKRRIFEAQHTEAWCWQVRRKLEKSFPKYSKRRDEAPNNLLVIFNRGKEKLWAEGS